MVKLEELPGEKKTHAGEASARTLHSVPSQTAKTPKTPSPRQVAVRVLRGTGQTLSTRQVVTHVRTLTGVEVTHTAVVLGLRRAKEAGEVEEVETTHPDGDRCARWRAV